MIAAKHRPQGGYPFRGDDVWDLSPYMSRYTDPGQDKPIPMFSKEPEELIKRLNELKKGESFALPTGYDGEESFYSGVVHSIDLGRYTHGFGKDEETGELYYSVADIFDTKGSGGAGKWGSILEQAIGDAYPVNLYGRIYLDDPLKKLYAIRAIKL